jgi:large subunit ribosomal protein L19
MSAPNALVQAVEKSYARDNALPEFRPGDTIKVWVKIREGEKTRLQAFEGVCIRRTRGGSRASFTVRKISYGVGVERIFPFDSPNVDRVELKAHGRVRRSRLYYLRGLAGKKARIRERGGEGGDVESALLATETATAAELAEAETAAAEPAAAAETPSE